MLHLRTTATDKETVWSLTEGTYLVGRGDDCRLRLENPRVSRHHAEITVSADGVFLRDLQSGNGVFVNGARARQVPLSPGDRVGFGPVEFLLTDDSVSSPPLRHPAEDTVLLERARVSGDALPSDTRRLRVLYQVAEELVSNLRRGDLLPHVLDALATLFRYDRCSISARDGQGNLTTLASRPEGGGAALSRTVAERVAREAQALLFDDLQGQASFDLGESVLGLNIRSVLCAPLVSRGEVTGLVYLDRSLPNAYDGEDLALLQGVAAMVAVALENARLYAEVEGRYEQTVEQLKVLEARLIETERAAALGQLALVVADAVRNPVMVIGGLARRLCRASPDGELGAVSGTIRGECDRLEETMKRVDALVSLPEPRVRPAALDDTVARAVEQVRDTLHRQGITLTVERCDGEGHTPHDPGLTRTALEALLYYFSLGTPQGGRLRLSSRRLGGAPPALVLEDERCVDAPPELRGVFEARASSELWSLDLNLALAERAMVAQGGDVRLGGGDRGFCAQLVLPSHC